MGSMGIIERCISEYSNPLVIVKKKNGKLRLCLDARELNKMMVKDLECPPFTTEYPPPPDLTAFILFFRKHHYRERDLHPLRESSRFYKLEDEHFVFVSLYLLKGSMLRGLCLCIANNK